jgi:hypothetical protein
MRMQGLWLTLAALVVVGCGGSPRPPGDLSKGDPSKKITWEQFQQMPPEEQGDPYVLTNLDDEAKKKFDELAKKQRR